LAAVVVMGEADAIDAQRPQPVADVVDQVEVGIPAGGGTGDQSIDHRHGLGRGSGGDGIGAHRRLVRHGAGHAVGGGLPARDRRDREARRRGRNAAGAQASIGGCHRGCQ
ncbi:MAG: hypothetical protein ACK559_37930, partial [bacterium]